jgi:hypothetical protein
MSPIPSHKSGVLTLMMLILFLAAGSTLWGQDDCATKIQEARKYYDQGLIGEIPQMLAPCMESGFTRAQKIEAYKLIILSYLFDDNPFEAEKTMMEFLKKFPEYAIMPNDPVEFVYLFESYRTTSVFSFGVMAGFNFTDPRIIEPYSVFDYNNTGMTNAMKSGFQVGVGAGRYITRKMVLNIEVWFTENRYSFTSELIVPLTGGNDGINTVTYNERLYKVDFPVTVTYEINAKKVNYFLRAGLSAAKLTGVTGNASRKYSQELPALTSETQDMSYYRKNMLYSGILGAGVSYKVPRGVVALDLRVNLGINNIVKPERRYENQDFMTKSYYIDDDFSLNSISLSAGYYFSFYKPKKQTDR